MRALVISLLVLAAAVVTHGADVDPEEIEYQVTVNGTARTYYLYVPSSYTGKTPAPLLVFFHGASDSCTRATNFMIAGFTREQEARQYLFAAPCGLNHVWSNNVDVEFASTLLADVAKKYNVDKNRLYSSGFSNGAGLTEYMGCTAPNMWTGGLAIAAGSTSVGSLLPSGSSNADILAKCDSVFAAANAKVRVIKLQGDIDPAVIPYGATGRVSMRDDFYGWALRNGCKGSPTTFHDDSLWKDERFLDCPTGVSVRFLMLHGVPHQWLQNATLNYNTVILDNYDIVAPTATPVSPPHPHPRARRN